MSFCLKAAIEGPGGLGGGGGIPLGIGGALGGGAGGIPGLDRILSGLSGGLGAGGLGSAGALGKIFYCHKAIRKTFLRWM